jgi:hypothetical protein
MEDGMNRSLDKIAALLALVIGAMGVLAGGQVLLGWLPGWNVLSWLPIFNFVVGIVTILLVAPLIWRGSRYALTAALVTFGANAAILVILLTIFRSAVATESLGAMSIRLVVWLVILGFMVLQLRRNQPAAV